MFDYFYGQSGEMFSYFRVPQILFRDIRFKDLSTDAKTLYGILLDRMGLSVKNGWLDAQGRVYIIFPVQEVMDALGCADNKATKLFRELEKFGFLYEVNIPALRLEPGYFSYFTLHRKFARKASPRTLQNLLGLGCWLSEKFHLIFCWFCNGIV